VVAAVPSLLLANLADARRRAEDWEDAWPGAVAAAVAEAKQDEREEWEEAISGTVESWRASYEGLPAPSPENALVRLHEPERCVPIPERPCERCGEEIQATRGPLAERCEACAVAVRNESFRNRRAVAA
jgi:hypothetical protein